MVLQRYNGIPIQELCFDKTAFWIQLHNLPFSLLTIDIALSIGETIGTVTKPKDVGEMNEGSFMRVWVEVDISKPLYRAKKSCGTKIARDGLHISTSVYRIFVTGAGLYHTTIKTVYYGLVAKEH